MSTHPNFEVAVVVTKRNDLPCIELRRVTTDAQIIKSVVSCAFHNRPIVILPKFKDTIQSLNNLIEKGVLYKKEEEYFFTF